MQTITPDTIIDSPRYVANGQGAWSGTVREAIHAAHQDDTGTALGNLHETLMELGWVGEDDKITADDHAQHMTLEDIKRLLDDPNATIAEG